MRLFVLIVSAVFLFGCATTEETTRLQNSLNSMSNEFYQFKDETKGKLAGLAKETEGLRRQLLAIHSSTDDREDRLKGILGKLDELEHQLQTYWSETKTEISVLKKGGTGVQGTMKAGPADPDTIYRQAFDAYQKGAFDDAVRRFEEFVKAFPEHPLTPNAYYWMGESFMNQKNYEKAIVTLQEIVDRHGKSDKVPAALLSQAEAFAALNDKKSSMTILKKVIELFPKTEEAVIAERKLRSLNL